MFNRTSVKLLFGAVVFALATCASQPAATAANIAWVTFHAGDNMPSTAAGTAGFTQAPDVGYTQLLASNGHTVNRVVTINPGNADPVALENYRSTLNAADLVIISRSVPSGHFGDPALEQPAERAFWHGITSPIMYMSGYAVRDNRLALMAGSTIPDTYAAPGGNTAPVISTVTLNTAAPTHAIFAGIALDGSNNAHYADTITLPPSITGVTTNPLLPQLGISVVTGGLVGGGVSLATVAGADNAAAVGGTLIGLWAPGSTVGGVQLAAHRMTFLSGTRERGGLTSEGSGVFDLSSQGGQLFLNAVGFMVAIPEPTSLLLALVGMLGLCAMCRRK